MQHLGDDVFYERQIAFMQGLLARKHFYATTWFQRHYEETARENLTRYLETLAHEGYAVVQ